MKKITFLVFFITNTLLSQVGVNTVEPKAMLDVNGDLRIRDVSLGDITDMLLVIDSDGNVKKLPLDVITQGCPIFESKQSNPHYLVFTSTNQIKNYNETKNINGISFVSAGTWVQNGLNYYGYTNISGKPLNDKEFTVNFGLNCKYIK